MPDNAPIASPAAMTGTRSRSRSISGSVMLRSNNMKPTSNAAAATTSPMVIGEVQPHS